MKLKLKTNVHAYFMMKLIEVVLDTGANKNPINSRNRRLKQEAVNDVGVFHRDLTQFFIL